MLKKFISWICHNCKHFSHSIRKLNGTDMGRPPQSKNACVNVVIIYLLTQSMEKSPSWEANGFTASQEFPRILWNPKVQYRIHKRPPPKPDQSSPCPHPTSWRSSHLRLGLPSGLFHSGFATKTLYTPLFSPIVLHDPPVSFFSIWSEKYSVRSTDH